MGEVKEKWSVTYTKHVKQKRKVYQDGFLHLLSNNKVMLYDECEQLLDSRILTKDEVVKSGESLPFNSFLVDIGDPESNTNTNTIPCPNVKLEYEDRTKETSTLCSKGKLNTAQKRTLANNTSPSRKIIRDFKKNELIKHEVQQDQCPSSVTNSSFTAMGEVKERWSVTYTKHVKQTHKVYQNGFLHLLSNNKVKLYDKSEQLLDFRFLTKDEIVKSGESLPFDLFLVEIGDLESNTIPWQNRKLEYEVRTNETSTLRSKGKLNIARKRTLADSISPSQKIIRDFKKNELIKHEVQQARSPLSVTNSSFTEWEALYTTQITQKAKKYHDGFIHVIACGSQGKQIMLYDSSKTQLAKRFLKKDEIVSSGESLTFDAYLVDIGDRMSVKEDDKNVTLHGSKITEKTDVDTGQHWQKLSADFKKNELIKHEVQQARSPSVTNSSFTEWEALYTTQITQKAKKYHDGFIRVIASGSQGRQIMLYDSSKTQLDKRFLKKDEIVSSGESLTFEAYLVDIGDCMSAKENEKNAPLHGSKMTEKTDSVTGQHWQKLSAGYRVPNSQRKTFTIQQGQFKAGKPPTTREKPETSGNSNVCSMGADTVKLDKTSPKHLRDAHQILSFLRNPTATDRTPMEEASAKQSLLQKPQAIQSDNKNQDFHSSLPYVQHESGMMADNCKDEDTKNEGHMTASSGVKDTQSKTNHDDLSTDTSSHGNKKAREVSTQGTQVGSALIDRLRASVHQGTAVIMDSGEDLSPAKSEGGSGTHYHQHRTKWPETFDAPSFDLGI